MIGRHAGHDVILFHILDEAEALFPFEGMVELEENSRAWAGAADSRVTAQALYEDLTTDIRPHLASIRTPVTLIVPWSDQGFGEQRTLAFYRRQYTTLANVSYVGVADAGHL